MDTQKGETRALSDDQLDAVSGGQLPLRAYTRGLGSSVSDEQTEENALAGFQQMLQELP
jgi:hypothetical protein